MVRVWIGAICLLNIFASRADDRSCEPYATAPSSAQRIVLGVFERLARAERYQVEIRTRSAPDDIFPLPPERFMLAVEGPRRFALRRLPPREAVDPADKARMLRMLQLLHESATSIDYGGDVCPRWAKPVHLCAGAETLYRESSVAHVFARSS